MILNIRAARPLHAREAGPRTVYTQYNYTNLPTTVWIFISGRYCVANVISKQSVIFLLPSLHPLAEGEGRGCLRGSQESHLHQCHTTHHLCRSQKLTDMVRKFQSMLLYYLHASRVGVAGRACKHWAVRVPHSTAAIGL